MSGINISNPKKISKNLVFGDPSPTGNPPTTFAQNTLLFEIGTGNIHQFVNGSWTEFAGPTKDEVLNNKTLDCSVSAGNVITNLPNTALTQITDKTKLPTDVVYLNDTSVMTNKTLDKVTVGPSATTNTPPAANYALITIEDIDANNQGVFVWIKKNGAFVKGQIF